MSATEWTGPITERLEYHDPPGLEGHDVNFRLVYQGKLPAEGDSPRPKEKHAVRRALHPQLAELWVQHPFLRLQGGVKVTSRKNPNYGKTTIEVIGANHNSCGYQFVPLLRKLTGATCALNVLFLRRDSPGGVIKTGGDIDNRLKVLFDGLKIPSNCNGIDPPQPGEDPFFVLLEDDYLITEVSVTTDRLLTPQGEGEKLHDVMLVIEVKTTLIEPRSALLRADEYL